MDTSVYLARLLGPVLAIAGIGILISPNAYLAMAGGMMNDAPLMYLATIMGLIGGLALLQAHNIWVADWRVVITILAWLTVIESAVWLLFPSAMRRLWAPLLSEPLLLVSAAIVLVAAAILCFFGYIANTRTGARS
ncbi:MAG TPA: hypothetical protein PLW75_13370 [Hyphomicrobium sp.]|nr:hypothetical protein [Hyphomicrobium sp.]